MLGSHRELCLKYSYYLTVKLAIQHFFWQWQLEICGYLSINYTFPTYSGDPLSPSWLVLILLTSDLYLCRDYVLCSHFQNSSDGFSLISPILSCLDLLCRIFGLLYVTDDFSYTYYKTLKANSLALPLWKVELWEVNLNRSNIIQVRSASGICVFHIISKYYNCFPYYFPLLWIRTHVHRTRGTFCGHWTEGSHWPTSQSEPHQLTLYYSEFSLQNTMFWV